MNKNFKIVGFGSVIKDAETQETIFTGFAIKPYILENIVKIWNENEDISQKLGFGNIIDEFLTTEQRNRKITDEQIELILDSLEKHSLK